MNGEARAADDDAMRSSANALTKKLYLTVMDVFGNYAGNDEEEYNNMIEALRNKQAHKREPPAPVKPDDHRGIIANKLLEGYSFHGGVCDKCVMPLMSYEGQVACAVCQKVDETKAMHQVTAEPFNDSLLALASTTGSDWSDCQKEIDVNKELSVFNEKRSQATQVYASKILGGYDVMHNQLCMKCDMPMMKYKGSVDCVFCPAEIPVQTDPNNNQTKQVAIKITKVDTPKPAKELSRAEVIAQRLKGMQSTGSSGNTENELEKAEVELLKMIEALGTQGNQGGEIGRSLQEFFAHKKADRAAVKRLKEAENGILEAEAIAASDTMQCDGGIGICQPVITDVQHDELNKREYVITEDGAKHYVAPATPNVEAGCIISEGFFPSLKKFFASASHDNMHNQAQAETLNNRRLEARKHISTLIAQGWEVSAESCPQCQLPLFSNNSGQAPNHCVMCGSIDNCNAEDNSMNQEMKDQEYLTKKMMTRIMEGWSILEGQNCPSCNMPTMFDPQTHQTHCIACEESGVPTTSNTSNTIIGGGAGTTAFNEHSMQSNLLALALSENMKANANVSAKQPAMNMTKKHLKVEIAPEPTYYQDLPDPTTSMCALRGKLADPTPSMQVFQTKMNVAAKCDQPTPNLRNRNEPTPAMKNEPTPHMEAVWNTHISIAPVTMPYAACDPTPSMHTLRGKLAEPTSSLAGLQSLSEEEPLVTQHDFPASNVGEIWSNQTRGAIPNIHHCQLSEPTPNMRSLKNKMNKTTTSHNSGKFSGPTPSMQMVRNKHNGHHSMAKRADHSINQRADPPSHMSMEAPGTELTNLPSLD
ncbi:hypothetical protein ACHAWF_016723 [Thalassiosira exigua]